ncbi:MAG TPA: dTMP kinase [Rhizomicrobium sp.]
MRKPPRFITFEGGEGTGKSTQVARLVATLAARKIGAVASREPGGSPGAEEIRKLVVSGEPGRWDMLTETLLVFAARADHVARTIVPALAQGTWVVCDRFTDSTYAYQGAGRGMARETIRRMEALVLHGFKPDLTFILDMPVEAGLARTRDRTHDENRFEKFDMAFHERMRKSFLDIAKRDHERCAVIDATADADTVEKAVWQTIAKRFKL